MRTTKTISVSLPPSELKLAERLAKSTNRSVSGVVREGLKRLAADQYWQQVQAMARPKAANLGITENDVDRLVLEHRQEKRARTIKKTLK
jgi:Arc/MetJ-type ribon-helix-helix transcriptional regulator